LLADPLITSSEIAKAIARDVGLTAKLLKIVNSAFFGLPRRVASLEYAISCLGTSMLRPVILASAAADKLGPRATKLGYDLELNERHGFLSGQLAAQFFTDKNTREDALTAGLLQNVGELLLVADGSEGALRAMARAKEQNVSLAEAECEEGTVSHARVGAYLLGAWGLPYTIVEAVAHHHDPTQVAHETFDVCDAVHVGMLIADHFLSRHVTQAEKAQQYLHDRGMDEHFDRSMELARRAMSEPDSELH
jgi:HD-like signal output (HDOD) protein